MAFLSLLFRGVADATQRGSHYYNTISTLMKYCTHVIITRFRNEVSSVTVRTRAGLWIVAPVTTRSCQGSLQVETRQYRVSVPKYRITLRGAADKNIPKKKQISGYRVN